MSGDPPAPNRSSKAIRGSMVIGRGLFRVGPADRVHVNAAVVVTAGTGCIHVLDAELNRGQGRVLAELVRIDLVDRCATADIGTLGLFRVRAGQEHSARPEMVCTFLFGCIRLRPGR